MKLFATLTLLLATAAFADSVGEQRSRPKQDKALALDLIKSAKEAWGNQTLVSRINQLWESRPVGDDVNDFVRTVEASPQYGELPPIAKVQLGALICTSLMIKAKSARQPTGQSELLSRLVSGIDSWYVSKFPPRPLGSTTNAAANRRVAESKRAEEIAMVLISMRSQLRSAVDLPSSSKQKVVTYVKQNSKSEEAKAAMLKDLESPSSSDLISSLLKDLRTLSTQSAIDGRLLPYEHD